MTTPTLQTDAIDATMLAIDRASRPKAQRAPTVVVIPEAVKTLPSDVPGGPTEVRLRAVVDPCDGERLFQAARRGKLWIVAEVE